MNLRVFAPSRFKAIFKKEREAAKKKGKSFFVNLRAFVAQNHIRKSAKLQLKSRRAFLVWMVNGESGEINDVQIL